ncbi:transposase [Arthrobacter sp. Leaf337]|uniref:transposase n=1 Tax=Arthrobacter sp. Leaf337 TaxID=1736342 RepID=UPI001910165E
MVERLLPEFGRSTRAAVPGHRQVVEGIICRYRCGIAWRDIPRSLDRGRLFGSGGTAVTRPTRC